tara:strand:+ start:6433 stop:7698 length:1266 start_codon:yes stop_codon:yes gene_type:complete
VLRHHYLGGKSLQSLQNIAVFFAEIPGNIKQMVDSKSLNPSKPSILSKHKEKKKFETFKQKKRDALLILPRYDHSLSRSIIDIINLNNFEVIHTYKPDSNKITDQIKNTEEFPRIKIDHSPIRIEYPHPLILDDGSLISYFGPLFKIGFCSEFQWINDEEEFHHSQMFDHEGNIWVGGHMNPKSKYVKKFYLTDYQDDSIIKINVNGKILFNKSVTEILIENEIIPNNFAFNSYLSKEYDPIHLNDIEPVFSDTKYWKKGDVFISIRNQSSIIHYRPKTNQVINYITGPFAQQHDVDIISEKEISIFNNNNFLVNNKHSEILVYNFETQKFKKLFNKKLQNENFKTPTGGLSHIFKDEALLVEEIDHGRIILFNNKGEKEWEFINKDKNGNIGLVQWSRVIEDKLFIDKFKSLVKNRTCKF